MFMHVLIDIHQYLYFMSGHCWTLLLSHYRLLFNSIFLTRFLVDFIFLCQSRTVTDQVSFEFLRQTQTRVTLECVNTITTRGLWRTRMRTLIIMINNLITTTTNNNDKYLYGAYLWNNSKRCMITYKALYNIIIIITDHTEILTNG